MELGRSRPRCRLYYNVISPFRPRFLLTFRLFLKFRVGNGCKASHQCRSSALVLVDVGEVPSRFGSCFSRREPNALLSTSVGLDSTVNWCHGCTSRRSSKSRPTGLYLVPLAVTGNWTSLIVVLGGIKSFTSSTRAETRASFSFLFTLHISTRGDHVGGDEHLVTSPRIPFFGRSRHSVSTKFCPRRDSQRHITILRSPQKSTRCENQPERLRPCTRLADCEPLYCHTNISLRSSSVPFVMKKTSKSIPCPGSRPLQNSSAWFFNNWFAGRDLHLQSLALLPAARFRETSSREDLSFAREMDSFYSELMLAPPIATPHP